MNLVARKNLPVNLLAGPEVSVFQDRSMRFDTLQCSPPGQWEYANISVCRPALDSSDNVVLVARGQ